MFNLRAELKRPRLGLLINSILIWLGSKNRKNKSKRKSLKRRRLKRKRYSWMHKEIGVIVWNLAKTIIIRIFKANYHSQKLIKIWIRNNRTKGYISYRSVIGKKVKQKRLNTQNETLKLKNWVIILRALKE